MKDTFYVVSKLVDGVTKYYKGGEFKATDKTKARHMTEVNADKCVRNNPGSKKEPYTDPAKYYEQGIY